MIQFALIQSTKLISTITANTLLAVILYYPFSAALVMQLYRKDVLSEITMRAVAIAQVDSTSASGSGILIAPNLVVTCNHVVISLASDIFLVKRDRFQEKMRIGRAIFLEPGIDLALLEVDPPFPNVPAFETIF